MKKRVVVVANKNQSWGGGGVDFPSFLYIYLIFDIVLRSFFSLALSLSLRHFIIVCRLSRSSNRNKQLKCAHLRNKINDRKEFFFVAAVVFSPFWWSDKSLSLSQFLWASLGRGKKSKFHFCIIWLCRMFNLIFISNFN
jgi:hypothetical protein